MQILQSASSSTRIAAAAKWINDFPKHAEILVVAPTSDSGDDFVRRAALEAGARFGVCRVTVDQLAAILAAPTLARRGQAPASALSLVAVAARAVHLLANEKALTYFGPVAAKPGFPTAIARTLEELRMNRAHLDSIRRLERGGEDLARLAERLCVELENAKLADRASVFEIAIRSIDSDPEPQRCVGLPMLLLDLAVWTDCETELIAKMTQRSAEVFASAVQGDTRTIINLERALACRAETVQPPADSSSLAKIKSHLFQETAPEFSSKDDTVDLKSWPGEARECAEIARRVQEEAARGVPFDQIAVLLRSPGEYRLHLEEAFRRAAIPAYFARGTTRPDPAGRALLALLACRAEDYSARRFAEYLSLGQVPDSDAKSDGEDFRVPRESALFLGSIAAGGTEDGESVETEPLPIDIEAISSIEGTLRAPWRWEQLLVDSSVIGKKDRWAARLEGLKAELKLRREGLEDDDEARAAAIDAQLRDLRHLVLFALPVIDALAALPERARWGEWLDHLRGLAVFALRKSEGVFETLAELAPMAPVGDVDLHEVQLVLGPRLRDLMVPPPRRRYGAVFVGSTDAARGMSFEITFVPGLAEKLFPRKIIEDPILLDAQRQVVSVAGPPGIASASVQPDQAGLSALVTQRDRVEAERLALKLAVGAASKSVHLSYPRIDVQQSRRRVPSFYGLEVFRAIEGRLPGFDELSERAESGAVARLGWPAPERADDAIDEAEYDLALLAPLIDVDPETAAGTANYLLSANRHLARALRSRSRKWLRRWTSYDGMVGPDELAQEALARQRLEARSFSPTALQNFAACPYRFFLQAIHRLQPRLDPVAIEVIDPLTRGSLFHKVQYEVLTLLRKAGMLPITRANVRHAIELVDDVLERVAAVYEDELAPAIPKVWEDGIDTIRADLREWLRRHSEAQDGWVPHKFELSFGLADRDRQEEDPASVPEAIPVIADLKLRGSIDLVERHAGGKLRATDHKTGKARAGKHVVVGGGQHLQPVMYALACEKLLGEPVESGRLYYCTAAGGYEERVVELNDFARHCAETVAQTVGSAIAEGFLPAAPDRDMCKWCDYLAVCGPNEERRVRIKPKERLVPLNTVRELP